MVHYGSISRYFQTHPNWAKRIAARIRQMSLIFWKCFGTSKAEVCSRNQSAGCWGCPMKHWVLAYKDRCQAVELFESLGAAQSSLPQLTTRHDGKTLDSSGTCIRLNWPTGARQFQGDKATYQPKKLRIVYGCSMLYHPFLGEKLGMPTMALGLAMGKLTSCRHLETLMAGHSPAAEQVRAHFHEKNMDVYMCTWCI